MCSCDNIAAMYCVLFNHPSPSSHQINNTVIIVFTELNNYPFNGFLYEFVRRVSFSTKNYALAALGKKCLFLFFFTGKGLGGFINSSHDNIM